ncbi:MAG: tetratricopeptide repeat protein [Candidatus Omnitrophica bacterium]|nr:tetratricopeptide repeat protein [Candidatus Omnitrophota bacterium]
MKRWWPLTVLVFLFLAPLVSRAEVSSAGVQELFLKAVEAYKTGDYETAVRLNTQALSSGVESPALHYNLGNSYLRSRQLGRAIASYLRAKRLAPGDVDVLANLSYARSMVSVPQPPETVPVWAVPLQMISAGALRWAALFIFMLTATLVLAALYAGLKRRKIIPWAIQGGVLCIYCILGAGYRLADEAALGVCLERTEVRFEPAPQATVYYKLPEGAEIRVLREKDGWIKIERADHKSGWVQAQSVARIGRN